MLLTSFLATTPIERGPWCPFQGKEAILATAQIWTWLFPARIIMPAETACHECVWAPQSVKLMGSFIH
jgi:hypothetical protein